MVRKRIVVKGNVQGVGYRVLVKKIARALGVRGLTRNLKNGDVEIYCEAKDKPLISFLKAIDIKRLDGNLLAIDVKALKVFNERDKRFKKKNAPARFDTFDIDYGEDLTFAEREMIERQELLILGGAQMMDKIDIVGENVDTVGQKVDTVGQKVDSMHEDMNKRFLEMNEKYHVISKVLISHTDALTKLVDIFVNKESKQDK